VELKPTREFTNETQKSMVADPLALEMAWPRTLSIKASSLDRNKSAELLFDSGPPRGKKWHVYVNMSVVEVDA